MILTASGVKSTLRSRIYMAISVVSEGLCSFFKSLITELSLLIGLLGMLYPVIDEAKVGDRKELGTVIGATVGAGLLLFSVGFLYLFFPIETVSAIWKWIKAWRTAKSTKESQSVV